MERTDEELPAAGIPLLEVKPGVLAQPAMSIVHIMAWTAGSALILGVFRQMVRLEEQAEYYRRFWRTGQMVMSMVYGASIGTLGLFLLRRLRGIRWPVAPFPCQPGHWYLLAHAVSTIVLWYTYTIVRWRITEGSWNWQDEEWRFQAKLWTVAAVYFVEVVFYLLAAFKSQTPRWIALFMALAGTAGLRSLAHLMATADANQLYIWLPLCRLATAITGVWMFVVVALDWSNPPKRDWLHWVGIAAAFAHSCLYWSWIVWSEAFG